MKQNEYFLVVHGFGAGNWVAEVSEEPQVLGRAQDCHIPLKPKSVSRRHARIWLEDGKPYIEDVESQIGTFVNNERITRESLAIGDIIQIASLKFELVDESIFESSPEDSETLPEHFIEGLTSRQIEVALLLKEGMSEKGVADRLKLSYHTVHTHVKRIYVAMAVRTRSELLKVLHNLELK